MILKSRNNNLSKFKLKLFIENMQRSYVNCQIYVYEIEPYKPISDDLVQISVSPYAKLLILFAQKL